ncbi:Branched-chain-amino-acid aminotransferase 3, chloroplastic [Capsicum annuum]|nr:Branched-chain-amino-acid aminotransferase 3, chloroplastic [Capsicum annuum]
MLKLKQVGSRYFTAPAVSSAQPSTYGDYEPSDIFDWDNLGFKLIQTDYMFMARSSGNGNFQKGKLNTYGNIELSPSAGVLNYGQGLIEGTKAYRVDDGRIFIFRPQENAIRMAIGAERMCMPSPSIQQFVDAVKLTALANKRWIPPAGKGSLYIRPLLIGNGPILGVAPAPESTFLVYACPVGNYLRNGTQPLTLYVEEELHRATQGGAGGVKAITNYAPVRSTVKGCEMLIFDGFKGPDDKHVMQAIKKAKERGYSDVLYLDSVHNKYIEEASAANIFLVKGKIISTPVASGTILEGITRKSIIDIAHDLGYQVEERLVEAEELINADEVFCTGTAVGVAPIGNLHVVGGMEKLNNNNYNTWSTCIMSYMQGQDLWEVVNGTEVTQPEVEDANGTLRKWKIKAGKAMFALKTTVEKDLLEKIRDAKTPNEAWDTFAKLFSKKNDSKLQLLESELLSVTQGNMTIAQYFHKVQSLCREIFEMDPKARINETRMKQIIIHGLKPEYRSFVAAVQGWQNQPSLVDFENLLAGQEALAKQMGGVLLKNEEEALYANKGKRNFKQRKNYGSKKNDDESKGH